MEQRAPVAVIVLTKDEELNLPACLRSVAGWVDQIFIVDSGSTDHTHAIAREYGGAVVQHSFESHGRQWEWAFENLPLDHDWVLGLDADQQITNELKLELLEFFVSPNAERNAGMYVNRRQIFRGSWIRHGGYYPKYLLKLFRRSRLRLDPHDLIDHHFHVEGPTGKMRGDLIEDNRKEADIGFWLDKQRGYALLLAKEELLRRQGAGRSIEATPFGSPDQRVAWLKDIWYRLPLYWRPTLYFLYRYVLRLGFLDGRQGFVFHVLQGFWLRLMADIHLDELINGPPSEAHADSRH